MECCKGRNEGRYILRGKFYRSVDWSIGRSLVGRVSNNGLENTQIENSRANFPVLGSLNDAN